VGFVTFASETFGDLQPAPELLASCQLTTQILRRPDSRLRNPPVGLRPSYPTAEMRTALLVSIPEAALSNGDGYPGVVTSALSGCSTIGNAKLPESFGLNDHFCLTQLQISSSAAFKPLLCNIEAYTTTPRFTPIAILHGIGCPRPIARSCRQVLPFSSGRGDSLAASALCRQRLNEPTKTRNKMGKARATRA
jgi:hypothetical protein